MPLPEMTRAGCDVTDRLEVQKSTTLSRLRAFLVSQADIMQEDVWHRLGIMSHEEGYPSAIVSAKYKTSDDNVKGNPHHTRFYLDLLEDRGRLQTSVVVCAGEAVANQYVLTENGALLKTMTLDADDTENALERIVQVVDEGTVRDEIKTLRSSHKTIDDKIHKLELAFEECKNTLPMTPFFVHPKIRQAENQLSRTKKLLWLPVEHVRDRSCELPLVGRTMGSLALFSAATS